MIDSILQFIINPQFGTHKNIVLFCFLVILSAMLTYLCRRYVRIMDTASARSLHKGSIPRSGGLAIVLTFLCGLVVYYVLHRSYFSERMFWGFLVGTIMVSLVSLYDDVTNAAFRYKVASQLVGVIVLMSFGLIIKELTFPFVGKVHLGVWGYPLTALWVVGFTNAFNFMDGINGLSAGVAVIVAVFFSLLALAFNCGFIFHISYFIAAACLGFLFFNYPKASIFMGDVGSTFLGFAFSAMAIFAANFENIHIPFMILPICFMNIIVETLYTFIARLLNGENVLTAHKTHPYQLLCRMNVPASIVSLFYMLQALCLFACALIYIHTRNSSLKLIIIFVLIVAITVYVSLVRQIAKKRIGSYSHPVFNMNSLIG